MRRRSSNLDQEQDKRKDLSVPQRTRNVQLTRGDEFRSVPTRKDYLAEETGAVFSLSQVPSESTTSKKLNKTMSEKSLAVYSDSRRSLRSI